MDTIMEVAEILAKFSYVVALTGAGISTESGIPDYRGPSGIWTKDPEAEKRSYEIYPLFLKDTYAYWMKFKERATLLPLENVKPNAAHYAFAELEKMGILKCIITQNIDNLHQKAGSKRVIDFHGNAFKLRCISCGKRYQREKFDIEAILAKGDVPRCECCYPLKSDVVYFGEPIPKDVYDESIRETSICDCMIVAGTSAVVYPAAYLPRLAKMKPIPAVVVEINLNPTPLTEDISDFFIQGKVGEILPRIVEEVKKIRN